MHFPSQVIYPTEPPRLLLWCVVCLAWSILGLSIFVLNLSLWGVVWALVGMLCCMLGIQRLFLSKQLPGALLLSQGQSAWCSERSLGEWIPGQLVLIVDVQQAFLLRFQSSALGGNVQWLWLSRRQAPDRWHLLRCAVYSRPVVSRRVVPSTAPDRSIVS